MRRKSEESFAFPLRFKKQVKWINIGSQSHREHDTKAQVLHYDYYGKYKTFTYKKITYTYYTWNQL